MTTNTLRGLTEYNSPASSATATAVDAVADTLTVRAGLCQGLRCVEASVLGGVRRLFQ